MRNSVIATLIACTFVSMNVQADDLLKTYQQALVNDAQYASARAALSAGQEKLPQARAGLLPSVGLSGGTSRTEFENRQNFSGSSYSLALSQPLFRWANWQQYEQGKLLVALSETQFAQTRQDLILRVAQAYFDVLAAQDTIGFVQAQKTAISEQLASAKQNFEVGTATITDSYEAQARYDLAVAQEYAAQSDLEIKRAALQQIIGSTPGDLAKLKTGVTLSPPQPAQIDSWVNSAEQQNTSVMGSLIGLEIAQRDISKNRAGHYPTVDLIASRNHGNQSGNNLAGDTNTIGVQWNIPLFAGFSVTSRVREAIALEDKARFDLETARRNAAQGARQSYLGVTSGMAQVNALEAAEISSLSALDANKLGYQVGVRINIDVLNAQQQLFSTRRDLAKARYDTIVNGLRLKSAAGILQEQDLLLVNGLLIH
ncbi:MAG: TolC family outer membrane protein [Glaciimonas sp.]|nr:TolC family outer membrane protein [Glaciimonas sp.]